VALCPSTLAYFTVAGNLLQQILGDGLVALFTTTAYPLVALIEDISLGKIGLPEIQRPFVWPNVNVRNLFDSLYRGYPVGYLLFWETGADPDMRRIGEHHDHKAPSLAIVDGQQRLTSLYAVIKGKEVIHPFEFHQGPDTDRVQSASMLPTHRLSRTKRISPTFLNFGSLKRTCSSLRTISSQISKLFEN
jgi:hypothetical protein